MEKFSNSIFFILFALHSACNLYQNHYDFEIFSGDHFIFEQAFRNIFRGEFFYTDFERGSHLAVHHSPILILLSPVMALFPSGLTLVLIVISGYSLSFFMLLNTCKSDYSRLLILYIACISNTRYNTQTAFHELALLPLPLTLIFVGISKRKLREFSAGVILCILIRETTFYSMLMLSAVLFLKKDEFFKVSAAWAAVGYISSTAARSMLSPGINTSIGYYYSPYGTHLVDIIKKIVKSFFLSDHLLPVLRYLGNLFFVALVRPKNALIVVPIFSLGFILTAPHPPLINIKAHYSVEIIWWALMACLIHLEKRPVKFSFDVHLLSFLLCAFMLCSSVATLSKIDTSAHKKLLQVVSAIPRDYPIYCEARYANHLVWRDHTFFGPLIPGSTYYSIEKTDTGFSAVPHLLP